MSKDVIGLQLPELELEVTGGGQLQSPSDFTGQWTLLYFYPKDDTPGCTVQACSYRDNLEAFEQVSVKLFGVSADNIASHEAFQDKFDLNFPLIFDEGKKLTEFLGSAKENGGIARDSFLLNPEGKVQEVWRGVDPKTTVAETLAAAQKHIH